MPEPGSALPPSTEELLRQTNWLRRLARGLGADDALASDLAQDALTQALQHRGGPWLDLRAWLATALRRRAGRWFARERARPGVERRAARVDAEGGTDEAVAQALVQRDVVDAVLALGEPYRTAILLRYLQDLPVREVARRTGAPVATVRSRLQRGLAQLRARLDRRYGSRAGWLWPLAPVAAPTLTAALLCMKTKLLAALVPTGVAVAAALWLLLPSVPTPTPPRSADPGARTEPAVAAAPPSPVTADRTVVAASPAEAAPPPTPLATASGTVVDEESLQPLAGVEVAWHSQYGGQRLPAAVVRTDAAGRFALPCDVAAPHERFELQLHEPGHAWIRQPLREAMAVTPDRYELGAIPLPPGTGLAGLVVDPAGAPVADAELLYCDTMYWMDNGRCILLGSACRLGRTQADGTFRADRRIVPGQDGLLLAAAPAGLGWLPLPQLTRARSELRALRLVLADAGALTVHVHDRNGAPLSGADVVAVPAFTPLGHPGNRADGLESVGSLATLFGARTDATGNARLPALPRGDARSPYRLHVHRDGCIDAELDCTIAEATPVEVLLAPPRSLAVRGRVADANGTAIPGAAIGIGRGSSDTTADAIADEHGEFRATTAVREPQLAVVARARGHCPQYLQLAVPPDRDELTCEFQLHAAADLIGTLLDERDLPVVGATVIGAGQRATTTTDARGRFVLPDLPPGKSFQLFVMPPEPTDAWEDLASTTVATADSPLTLRLRHREAATCRLNVDLLTADGTPLEVRRQWLLRDDRDWHDSTATIGHIAAGPLPPGAWTLRIAPNQGPSLLARFTIAPDASEHRLTLQQARAATVTGEIVAEPADLALPPRLRLRCGGDNAGHFVPGDGQHLEGDELELDPARAPTFRLEDVDPTRPLQLFAGDDTFAGDAVVTAGADAGTVVRIRVGRTGSLRFVPAAPWPARELAVFVHRPGTDPAPSTHVLGAADGTPVDWPAAAGAWQWRIECLTPGNGEPVVFAGSAEVRAGSTTEIRVDAASRH